MNNFFWICLISLLFMACGKSGKRETPTEGSFVLSADPAVGKVSAELADAFNFVYKYTDIQVQYMRESDAINALLEDSVRLIIIPGTLSPEMIKALQSQRIYPKIQPLALDAIAIILHPDNPDSLLSPDMIRDILSGKIKNWKETGTAGLKEDIQVVIDESGSSVANYLSRELMKGEAISARIYAAGSNPGVIEYVSTHKGAIGCIGVNWICNSNDSMAIGFLKQVRPAHIQNPEDKKYYLPFQAWIGQGLYPFRRMVNAISLETHAGPATGFIAYAASEKGQRIILKSGLMPVMKPTRMIEIR